ncbi:MAG: glycosyltransferase family 39 protein [Faecalibacterium sp.]
MDKKEDVPLGMKMARCAERIFLVLFCMTFSAVLFGVVFYNTEYQHTAVSTLALILVALQGYLMIYRALSRHITWLTRYFHWIVGVALLLLFAGNLWFGLQLRFSPIFDLGAIFDGAQYWVETGSFMHPDNWAAQQNYYYYFGNNLGGLTCFYLVFSLGVFLGMRDYYLMALLFTSICVVITVCLSVLIARRCFGLCQAMMALVFFLTSLPFWFMGATFYTDSLSIVFPVAMMYLYLRYCDVQLKKRRYLWLLLLGVVSGLGIFIKATVGVMLVAILIYHLCTKGLLASVALFLPFALALLLCTGVTRWVESNHMEQDKIDQLQTPALHWVMMSLRRDNGRYNGEDYTFTRSFEDTQLRDEMIQQEIITRIKERGFSGMYQLFFNKSIVVFGDGTYGQSDFLDDNPVSRGALHEYVLYDGTQREDYASVCTGVFFAITALVICSAVDLLFDIKKKARQYIPQLAVFGIWLFLMCWECTARYTTNYVPMMILCAVSGVACLDRLLATRFTKKNVQ